MEISSHTVVPFLEVCPKVEQAGAFPVTDTKSPIDHSVALIRNVDGVEDS
jgi:hypothetical protein